MAFAIRRNYPYIGALTLCKLRSGSFEAKEMVVSESVFCQAVMAYLDKLTPADLARLRRVIPAENASPPAAPAERKKFRVKAAQAAT